MMGFPARMRLPMHEIFINHFGRLRSGWRLLIFSAAFIALSVIWAIGLRLAFEITNAKAWLPHPDFVLETIFRTGLLLLALGLGFLCAQVLEDLPWRSLGLTFHKGWFRDLLIGCAIGFASLFVAVAVAMAGKGLRFSFNDAGLLLVVRSMIGSAALFFVGALAEEAMFRGYALQTLTRAKLAWLGVLLTSLPFGLAHLWNPNVSPLVTFANTSLAGIWLAVAYLRTRSLWLVLGVHWIWNWALGWFFGLPVSGLHLVSYPLLRAQDLGPRWLTGGTYGTEASIGCTIALILFTIFLWRTSMVSATPELMKLTSEENPVTSGPVLSISPKSEPSAPEASRAP
jgi:CAAX protease family protein